MNNNMLTKFLQKIEVGGNKLPHPSVLFLYGIAIVITLSVLLSIFNVSVVDLRPETSPSRSATGFITANNLLNFSGIAYMLTHMVSNFVNFAPFGAVIVAFLGVAIAEKSGFIEISLRALVNKTPKVLLTMVIILLGVVSNVAADVGYVVLIPLGATIFLAVNRHPVAGIVVMYAAVSGGFSANLLIGALDPLLSGISQEAAKLIDANYLVGAQVNYYFMFVSTFLVVGVILLINRFITEPQLGKYIDTGAPVEKKREITKQERLGIWLALLYAGLLSFFIYLGASQKVGFLLNPVTKSLDVRSPFFNSLIAFVFLYFAGMGLIYGLVSGTFKEKNSVIKALENSIKEIAPFIALVFVMAQFINYFNYSNLGIMFAIALTNLLKSINFVSPAVLVIFIFVIALANLLMSSASAKWSLFAPVFVPAFMLLGYSPEVAQVAYRIGDSATNIISPMAAYLGIILFTLNKYNKNAGIGTVISLMLPYSVALLVVWPVFFYVWVFVLGLPIGPGAEIFFK